MRSAIVVLALAASASASPLHLKAEHAESVTPQASVAWDEVPMVFEIARAPCKKHTRRPAGFGRFAGFVPSSIDTLLSKLVSIYSSDSAADAAGARYDPAEPALSVDDIDSASTTLDKYEILRLTELGMAEPMVPPADAAGSSSGSYDASESPLSMEEIEAAPSTLDGDEFRRLTDLAIAQLMGPPELEGPAGAGLPVLPVHAHSPPAGYDSAAVLRTLSPTSEPRVITFVHGPVTPPARHPSHPPHPPQSQPQPHAHHSYGGPQSWHKRARSFPARLQRALRALSPIEALIMAFVLGSGIGSILHFFFMLVLLAMRKCSVATSGRSQVQRSALALEGEDAMVQNVVVARVNEKEQAPSYDSVVPLEQTA